MASRASRLLYAATVFWSAVLVLLVQPILTKAILPWFGGSPGVWVTSMLFYQVLLLGGYAYAHMLARTLPVRQQVLLHAVLLGMSFWVLPLQPSRPGQPGANEDPVVTILSVLFRSASLPYFLLSATSPLLQSWYALRFTASMPYRLFAISNLGSLCALLAYPVIVEPLLTVGQQLMLWSSGYALFGILCAAVAMPGLRLIATPQETIRFQGMPVWLWLALSACPSVLWLAVANHLSQDVAAVPFLWVLPLGIYLLSFILCFNNDFWYRPRIYRWLLPPAWAATCYSVAQSGALPIKYSVGLLAFALFVCCMFCHGELARLRPQASGITAYYLTLSAGGALGGIFVGLVAPRIFTEFLELPAGLLGCVLLSLGLLYRFPMKRLLRVGGTAAAATAAALLVRGYSLDHSINLRNFYGTLQVSEMDTLDLKYRSLYNGTIQHGVQYLSAARSRIPTSYYGAASGVALALWQYKPPRRIGVVGLGVGTLAAYGKAGDVIRFYEINPTVIHLAQAEFRYLRESAARIELVQGDARLSMEREDPQEYDVLAVDAFSGDSIPIHLLTREAFKVYFRHLKPSGALAMHVTNKHINLHPVVKALAEDMGARALLIHNSSERNSKIFPASWIIVTRNALLAETLSGLESPIKGTPVLWTDDFSNLFRLLK
ncbi:MAG: fused MFS/spermidine synthase [Bryobacteraceae bacterium]